MNDELIYIVKFQADEQSLKNVQAQANAIQEAQAQTASTGQASAARRRSDAAVKAARDEQLAIREVTKEIRAQIDTIDLAQRQRRIDATEALAQYEAIETRLKALDQTNQQVITRQRQLFFAQERARNGFVTLSASMRSVEDSSKGATIALANIGRIAQDLPFGFIGISNNIDPLLVSFRNLRTEMGSTGLAIRAILRLLGGPLGMVFLLGSILPSAIVIAQSGIMGFGKKSKEAMSGATDSVKQYEDALKSAASAGVGAFVDSIATADEQIRALNTALKGFGGVASEDTADVLANTQAIEEELRRIVTGQGQYNAAIASTTRQLDPALEKQVQLAAEQEKLNGAVRDELESRLAVLKADEAIRRVMADMGLIQSESEKSLRRATEETRRRRDLELQNLAIMRLQINARTEAEMAGDDGFQDFSVSTEAIANTTIDTYNRLALESIAIQRQAGDSAALILQERNVRLRALEQNRLSLGLADQEAFEMAKQNIVAASEQQLTNLTENEYRKRLAIASDFANAFIGIASGLFGQNKAVAIATALINTYLGASEALAGKGSTFQKIAEVSAILATGFAQVQNIRRTNIGSSGSVSQSQAGPSARGGFFNPATGAATSVASSFTPTSPSFVINATVDRRGIALAVRDGEAEIKSDQITFSS